MAIDGHALPWHMVAAHTLGQADKFHSFWLNQSGRQELFREQTTDNERRSTDNGRRMTEDGRRTTDDGRRKTDYGWWTRDDGQRTMDDGRRTTDDGWRTTDDGQRTTDDGQVRVTMTIVLYYDAIGFGVQQLGCLYSIVLLMISLLQLHSLCTQYHWMWRQREDMGKLPQLKQRNKLLD